MSALSSFAAPVVDRADNEDGWRAARAERVTATDVSRLAAGGIQTRRSILAEKMNGSSFYGNADTERGHRREAILADWAKRHFGIRPNSALWVSIADPFYAATPDGLAAKAGLEIKSTIEDWITNGIPLDYLDQCQWGMVVTGRDRWLFVWEQIDADGQFPLEPEYRWIERDEARIVELRAAADKFIEWRAAGAPTVDGDMTEELDELISQHVAARSGKNRFEAREKAAEAGVRGLIAADEIASTKGWDRSGTDGGLLYKVTPRTQLDLERWATDDPHGHAEYESLTAAADALYQSALERFQKPAEPATRLTIAAHKPVKGAAA